jgi:hypothetical protein
MKKLLLILLLTSTLTVAAQSASEGNHTSQFSVLSSHLEYKVETQATFADGDYNPLWLNANKYGLSSLDTQNGYLRAAISRPVAADSLRRWGLGAMADIAVGYGMTSTFVVQQAYGELRWLKGLLTVGSKEQPAELKNNELSSGSQCLGINARPVPQVRLSLPDYWDVPFTRSWLGLKGHFSYGRLTDDAWQREFTHERLPHTEDVLSHSKAGYLRLHKPGSRFTAEAGLEMACLFGGRSVAKNAAGEYTRYYENQFNLKSFIRAIIPGGNDGERYYGTHQENQGAEGNHVGAWTARLSWDEATWGVSLYGDHYFEDISQLFHLDYDGYGNGEAWRTKQKSRFLVYDLKDILLGVELRLKRCPWLSNIVLEYLHTKYQSGPIYHDHEQGIPDHIGGLDSYYQHSIYNGWLHWGQVMGNPLYRSALYNADGQLTVKDSRFRALHVGVSGTVYPLSSLFSPLFSRVHYRLLGTVQKGYGTYGSPFVDPRRNLSLLAETTCALRGWAEGVSIRLGLGLDRGSLLGDNTGAQLTIIYQSESKCSLIGRKRIILRD